MQTFNVTVDVYETGSQPNARSTYMIAILPFDRNGGGMGIKDYSTREAFVSDLQQRLRYTPLAVERLFSNPERFGTLTNFPMTNEDAAYFGWPIDFDRN